MNALKIVELRAENVKRLKAVHIRPEGKSVTIGGDNDQGKSSVLDSILYAIGGERAICEEPLRRGQKKGEVTVDLGEFVITRRFTEAGGSLIVRSRDGALQPSPQRILDQLVGKLSFDPLKFMAMDARAQRECLAQLAGLDFTQINAEYEKLYAERTDANREAQRLQSQLLGKKFTPGLPAEEQSIADLMTELEKAQAHNETLRVRRQGAEDARVRLEQQRAITAQQRETVEKCRKALQEAEAALERAMNAESEFLGVAQAAKASAASIEHVDEDPYKDAISSLCQRNTVIRANADYTRTKEEHRRKAVGADGIDLQCKALLERKKQMVAEAQFPLPELSVTDDAVLYGGIPLKQAATSQQILVSASIGIALNPTLRVMFIREGSLLDLTALQALYDLAYMQNVQLWIERVSKGDEVSVIIEDGAVAANRLSAKQQTVTP